MPPLEVKLESHSIVLLGDFNPKILHPFWFAAYDLIPKKEADEAELVVSHPEVTEFRLEWMRLGVVRDKFAATAWQSSYYEHLRDLVTGTFKILRHTPLRMMGINRQMHFQLESQLEWHGFGHKLAPKEIWDGLLEQPGMQSLSIQGVRDDGLQGSINVKVQPSPKVENGVFLM